MMKQVFRSYIATLHPRKRENLKENPKSLVHVFISLCIFIWFLEEVSFWFIVLKVLPLFMIKWSNLEIGSYMGKAMLLCPMKQENRKEYINCMIGFKIGCPLALGILIETIWSIVYSFDIRQFLLLMIIYISYGIAETIHIDCIDKVDNRILPAKKDAAGNVKWAWLNFSVSFIAIFLFIMDVIILCTQYKDMIEEATEYELAFHIPGRLHYVKEE